MKATREQVKELRRDMGMADSDKRRPWQVVVDAVEMLERVHWSNGSVHETIVAGDHDGCDGVVRSLQESIEDTNDAVCAIGAVGLGMGRPQIKRGTLSIEAAATRYNDAAYALVKAAFNAGSKAHEEGDGWLIDHNDNVVGSKHKSGSLAGKRRVQNRLCRLARRLRARGF